MDAALLTALEDAEKHGVLRNTIFVALSKSTFNKSPITPPGYTPKDATDALASQRVVLEKANQRNWGTVSSTHTRIENKLVWRIYIPSGLAPLGTFAHSRREGVAAIWGAPADLDWDHIVTPPRASPAASPARPGAETGATGKPIDPLPIVIGAFVAMLILGALCYIVWLQKPRPLEISGDTWRIPASVVFGKPLYLGTSQNIDKNIVELAGLPAGLAPGTKLARVEVGPIGIRDRVQPGMER